MGNAENHTNKKSTIKRATERVTAEWFDSIETEYFEDGSAIIKSEADLILVEPTEPYQVKKERTYD